MELKKLSKELIAEIYNTRMKIDFPPEELKPRFVILDGYDKGIYEGLGLYDGAEIVGYTYLVKQSTNYLVDYLAVFPDKRNTGIGSALIKLLSEYIGDNGRIVVEVEDPEYAQDAADRELRTRRLNFYLRNGCHDTGVRVKCFGVEFILLTMGTPDSHKEKNWEVYSSLYKAILPPGMYDENIELLGYTND